MMPLIERFRSLVRVSLNRSGWHIEKIYVTSGPVITWRCSIRVERTGTAIAARDVSDFFMMR